MQIDITIKESYGRRLYYCMNESVCALVGKITLDERDMRALREMGHTVSMVREPLIVDGVRVV